MYSNVNQLIICDEDAQCTDSVTKKSK